uniref:Ycf20 n=1 Tax=Udotea sp. TZ0819 TaxID=2364085 RepID=A0A386B2B7_9CHLO|nr:hypothetical protein Ycf20 [Udotea sp. TZ0819]
MFLIKQKNYLFLTFCYFSFGFLIGNLFGTFLVFLRNQFLWDGIVLLIILILFEILNFLIANTRFISQFFKKILKSVQIGILLGFFIDAFKVGS